MTGAKPPRAILFQALKAELREMRACLDSVISLLADAGDLDSAEAGLVLETGTREIRLRLERTGEHLTEIVGAMTSAPPQPNPVGLAEVREILECITNDRLALAQEELRALLARFPEEPQ